MADRPFTKAPERGLSERAIEHELVQLAERQNGNVTYRQLLAHQLSRREIQGRVRAGRMHSEFRGVYSLGRPARTPVQRAAAAVLACGPGALLSHGSALALWGQRKEWPQPIEVSAPRQRRHPGIDAHRVTTLTQRDRRCWRGIAVTSLARTLLDCAAEPWLSDGALTRAVNDGMREGILFPSELSELLDRRRHQRGAERLRPFTGELDQPTRSGLEDAFLSFCRRHGLPSPLVNRRVGSYEVDAYFPAADLIVEVDGWKFHRDRDAFERDRERDADALAEGRGTLRITERRLTGPLAEREAERLGRVIALRERQRERKRQPERERELEHGPQRERRR